MEDLQNASKLLVQALGVRERYMRMSRQRFPNVCQSFLRRLDGDDDVRPAEKPRARSGTLSDDKATIEGTCKWFEGPNRAPLASHFGVPGTSLHPSSHLWLNVDMLLQ